MSRLTIWQQMTWTTSKRFLTAAVVAMVNPATVSMLQTSPFVGMALILRIIATARQLGSEHLQNGTCWVDIVEGAPERFFRKVIVGYTKSERRGATRSCQLVLKTLGLQGPLADHVRQ